MYCNQPVYGHVILDVPWPQYSHHVDSPNMNWIYQVTTPTQQIMEIQGAPPIGNPNNREPALIIEVTENAQKRGRTG